MKDRKQNIGKTTAMQLKKWYYLVSHDVTFILFHSYLLSSLLQSFSYQEYLHFYSPQSMWLIIIYWYAAMELLGTSLKNILISTPQLKRIICQRYFFDTEDIFPNNFILVLSLWW